MRDLRKQALESKKTVSRKAQSKELIRNSASVIPRNSLRGGDRHGSDGIRSISGSSSVNCMNAEASTEIPINLNDKWIFEIGDRLDEIMDRKRSSTQSREKALIQYAKLLMNNYAYEEIKDSIDEVMPVIIKSVKAECSEQEACSALHAIALTMITAPSETIYDAVEQELKYAYKTSRSYKVKALAIHTLSTIAIYGGASNFEINEIMGDYMEMINSNGSSVKEASESSEVVCAACEAWGYLATYLYDIEGKEESVLGAFMDQILNSDTDVQIAAGENIALIFESYHARQNVEDINTSPREDTHKFLFSNTDILGHHETSTKRDQLMYHLSKLANESSKHIAKKDRKRLHSSFSDIINTCEHPTRGPRFQNAIDMETGKRYGSRMSVRTQNTERLTIDKWWKFYRSRALKRVLGAGFMAHLRDNKVVFDSVGSMFQKY